MRGSVEWVRKGMAVQGDTYALFPCPGVKVLPSSRVTGSKGDPLAKTHLLNGEERKIARALIRLRPQSV